MFARTKMQRQHTIRDQFQTKAFHSIHNHRCNTSKPLPAPHPGGTISPEKKNGCQNHGGRCSLRYGHQKSNQKSMHRSTRSLESQTSISSPTHPLSPGPYPVETSPEVECYFLWHHGWKLLQIGCTGNHYKWGSHLLPMNNQSDHELGLVQKALSCHIHPSLLIKNPARSWCYLPPTAAYNKGFLMNNS